MVGACGCESVHATEVGSHQGGPEADRQVLTGHEIHLVVVADSAGDSKVRSDVHRASLPPNPWADPATNSKEPQGAEAEDTRRLHMSVEGAVHRSSTKVVMFGMGRKLVHGSRNYPSADRSTMSRQAWALVKRFNHTKVVLQQGTPPDMCSASHQYRDMDKEQL